MFTTVPTRPFAQTVLTLTDWTLATESAPLSENTQGQSVARSTNGALTVAGAWRCWGELNLDDRGTTAAIDDHDHVFATRLPVELREAVRMGNQVILHFGGVATIADVYLNDALIAHSESMHNAFAVDITELLDDHNNELRIVIRSLTEYLDAAKWARPKWKTRLVSDQRLRNVRTALLGRISWAPPTPVAGPYGGVSAIVLDPLALHDTKIATTLEQNVGAAVCHVTTGLQVDSLELQIGDHHATLTAVTDGDRKVWSAGISIPDVPRWMPHSHGQPSLLPVTVTARSGGSEETHALAPVGFRTIRADESDGGFTVIVNDVPIFARGAVAFPFDVVGAHLPIVEVERRLQHCVRAGINMIRFGNIGWYEPRELHEVCDRLGILVWQDLAFASLDYPSTPEFRSLVELELQQQIAKLAAHPSTAIICGSSEVEQQAAMMGVPASVINESPGRTWIADAVRGTAPDIPYVASSPTAGPARDPLEGSLPFRVNSGVSHYFGVGAYLRPLDDADSSGVRFASECLAFANVGLSEIGGLNEELRTRVPKDSGSDWDFDDVRTHYLDAAMCPGTAPSSVQHAAITGHVMASTFARWRAGDRCAGGLVLALQDPWDSAGWGLLDSAGNPKPVLAHLARSLQPVAVLLVDRGLNGLEVCVVNDAPAELVGELRIRGIKRNGQVVVQGSTSVQVPGHGKRSLDVEAVWGRFADATYAYRFGAPAFDLVHAQFVSSSSTVSATYHLAESWGDSAREVNESDFTVSVESFAGATSSAFNVELLCASVVRMLTVTGAGWAVWPNSIDVVPGFPVTFQVSRENFSDESWNGTVQPRSQTLTLSAVNLAGAFNIAFKEPGYE